MTQKFFFAVLISVSVATGISAQHNEPVIPDSVFFHENLNSFAKGNNHRRFRFIKKYSKRNNLNNLAVKTQAIDWLGLYKNVIIEKKGATDSIVYLVCHYDKVDGSLLAMPNLFLNGGLDILLSNIYLSKGAYDNGTGVVSLLGLLEWMNNHDTHYTYRFLFAGMEEYGLRGSRRHVSSVPLKEWNKCVLAINIDMIAGKGAKIITVTKNASDQWPLEKVERISKANHFKLIQANIPPSASSDFRSFQGQSFLKDFGSSFMFNLTGAFIPQRSYFTKRKHRIPVVNFSDDITFGAAELVSTFSPISFGTIHSFHDRASRVSYNNLVEYSRFFRLYIDNIDRGDKSQGTETQLSTNTSSSNH